MEATVERYTVIYGWESEEIADEYEMLIGPDGFECCITEPEDRTFGRDLRGVVAKLNDYDRDIKAQTETILRLRAAIENILRTIPMTKIDRRNITAAITDKH